MAKSRLESFDLKQNFSTLKRIIENEISSIFQDNVDQYCNEISKQSLDEIGSLQNVVSRYKNNPELENAYLQLNTLIAHDTAWCSFLFTWSLKRTEVAVTSSALQITHFTSDNLKFQKSLLLNCQAILFWLKLMVKCYEESLNQSQHFKMLLELVEITSKSSPSLDWIVVSFIEWFIDMKNYLPLESMIDDFYRCTSSQSNVHSLELEKNRIFYFLKCLNSSYKIIRCVAEILSKKLKKDFEDHVTQSSLENRRGSDTFHNTLSSVLILTSNFSGIAEGLFEIIYRIGFVHFLKDLAQLGCDDFKMILSRVNDICKTVCHISGPLAVEFLNSMLDPTKIFFPFLSEENRDVSNSFYLLAEKIFSHLLGLCRNFAPITDITRVSVPFLVETLIHFVSEFLNVFMTDFNPSYCKERLKLYFLFFSAIVEVGRIYGSAHCVRMISHLLLNSHNDQLIPLIFYAGSKFSKIFGNNFLKLAFYHCIECFEENRATESQILLFFKNLRMLTEGEIITESSQPLFKLMLCKSALRTLLAIKKLSHDSCVIMLEFFDSFYTITECYFSMEDPEEVPLLHLLEIVTSKLFSVVREDLDAENAFRITDYYKELITSIISLDINLQNRALEIILTFCVNPTNIPLFTGSLKQSSENFKKKSKTPVLESIQADEVFFRSYFHSKTELPMSLQSSRKEGQKSGAQSALVRALIRNIIIYKMVNMILSCENRVTSFRTTTGSSVIAPFCSQSSESAKKSDSVILQTASACLSFSAILNQKLCSHQSILFSDWPCEDIVSRGFDSFIHIYHTLEKVPVFIMFINTIAPIRPSLCYCKNIILSYFAVIITKWDGMNKRKLGQNQKIGLADLITKTNTLLQWILSAGWIPESWGFLTEFIVLLQSDDAHCVLGGLWQFLNELNISPEMFHTKTDQNNTHLLVCAFPPESEKAFIQILKYIMINDLEKFSKFYRLVLNIPSSTFTPNLTS